jgi:hypothetical protein
VLLALLAAGAPLLWMAMDLAVTGDALHSLHATATVARESHLRRGVGQVPEWTARFLAFTLREPVVIGIPIGLWLAWRHRRAQAALVVAVAVSMMAVFAVEPIFDQPLLARYIRTPAVLLTLFFGLAVAGWLLLPEGRERRNWMIAGLAMVALTLAFVPANVSQIRALQTRTAREGAFYRDLRRATRSRAVARAFAACTPLSLADHRPLPYVRYWLRGRPGSVTTVEAGSSPLGRLLLVPRRSLPNTRFYGRNLPRVTRPPTYHRVYHGRGWTLFAAPACG